MDTRALLCLIAWMPLLAISVVQAGAAPPVTWQGATEIAKGRGERGPWQQSRSRYDFVDDPAVAIDERGEIAVAWVDQKRKAVLFQRFSSEGRAQMEQPVDVSRHPETFSWLPRVAIAPDAPQKIHVLWQEIIFSGGSHGGDILFARSDDGGRSFAAPLNLSRSVGGDGKGRINKEIWHNGSLDLAAGPNGVLYAAWTEYDGPLWIARSADGGSTFSRPARVPTGAQPARGPSLALGPDGALYLAWTVGDSDAGDIHLVKSTDGGRSFGTVQRVGASRAYSDAPKLAVDKDGVVHMAYAQSSSGPFGRYHIRYTRSADAGRTFEPPREISHPLPEGSASASFPALSVDARGRVVVLFELFNDIRRRPRGLALSVSTDGGAAFTAPVMVPGSVDGGGGFNGSSQGLLMNKLAVNGSGALAIVNSSLKPDSHSRVWLTRANLPQ